MPTKITQVEDVERKKTILHIEGEMFYDDAILLQKIALQMRGELNRNLTLDLADLDLLDSESASILRQMEREGFLLEGLDIFLQKTIDETERWKSQLLPKI